MRSLGGAGRVVVDCHTHVGIDEGAPLRGQFPYGLSVEDLLIRMDALGITHAISFPISSAFYDSRLAASTGAVRRDRRSPCRWPYEVENTQLLLEIYEVFPESAGRILPFAMVDPSRMVAEQARHLATLGRRYPVFGLKALMTHTRSRVADLVGRGARLLAFAREHDLPVLLHTSVDPADIWANVFDALRIVRGQPEVRFTLAHACRLSRSALDQADDLPNCFVDLSALHIHCRLAVAGSPYVAARADRFPADYQRPGAVMKALASCYPKSIVWGSDVPFHNYVVPVVDSRKGKTLLVLRSRWDAAAKALFRMPSSMRRLISHVNPRRFLFGETQTGRRARRASPRT